MTPTSTDWNALLSPLIAPIVGILLTFIARYIRDAAVALQQRNSALDAFALTTKTNEERIAKLAKDVSEAWGRLRALEGAQSATQALLSPKAQEPTP